MPYLWVCFPLPGLTPHHRGSIHKSPQEMPVKIFSLLKMVKKVKIVSLLTSAQIPDLQLYITVHFIDQYHETEKKNE